MLHLLTRMRFSESFKHEGECQGHTPSISTLSLKFGTSYMTYRRTACSAAARNPGEITILLAFICREPSCIQKHNSPLRFVFQLHCTSICIQRGPLGSSAVRSADEVFITQDFAFWYVTPILFPFQLEPNPPPLPPSAAGDFYSSMRRPVRFDRRCDINRRDMWHRVAERECDRLWICSEPRSPSSVYNGPTSVSSVLYLFPSIE